ncbi:MAG: hypothetical protein J6R47_05435 [Acholeplasmatales bacterium]|nr:hypothetical protein [Acholeplasmatales bacterium]
MGLIKDKLATLKEADLYSIILFALAKLRDIPEYSGLSELAYVLDKPSLIKVCQIFGGLTITIPTLSELENISYALLLYEYIDVNGIPFEDSLKFINNPLLNLRQVKDTYYKIKNLLAEYDISSRGAN